MTSEPIWKPFNVCVNFDFITLFINEGTPDNQAFFIFERFSNIGHLFLSLQVVRDKNIIEVLLTFCVYVFLNALKLSYMSILF